jgi:dimethylargininase
LNDHSLVAITRKVSPAIQRCELTFQEREPIDFELAQIQHQEYEQALRDLGCLVTSLPAESDLPDSVFVEDVAIVLDELAVITRPGAVTRRPETATIAQILSHFRPLERINPPGTLDGGDVLHFNRILYVGISSRSNLAGITQLEMLVSRFGYRVKGLPIVGFLHLKSVVTQVGPETLLVYPGIIDRRVFGRKANFIEADRREPLAANALWIGEALIYPTSFPLTHEKLETNGYKIQEVNVSEIQKAEGAVTCCSLILGN